MRSQSFVLFLACALLGCDGGTQNAEGAGASSESSADDGSAADSAGVGSIGDEGESSDSSVGFVNADGISDSWCVQACDQWTLEGCGEGEKCTAVGCDLEPTQWDQHACVPVYGDQAAGEECEMLEHRYSGMDTCAAGAMCIDVSSDTGLGTCRSFCRGTPTAPICGAGERCVASSLGVPAVCSPHCDPLVQDCESPEYACLPSAENDAFVCLLDVSQGLAPRATPCDSANPCNAGLVCAEAGKVDAPGCDVESCCTPMCDKTAPATCEGANEECVSLDVGDSTVGACQIPEGP